jgi:molecular chaperone HscA
MNKGVFEVLATGGDSSLGGDDMDHAIGEWILTQANFDSIDTQLTRQVLLAARAAKEKLTKQGTAKITIQNGAQHWQGKIDRARFDALILPLVKKTLMPCRRVLRDANLSKHDISTGRCAGRQ